MGLSKGAAIALALGVGAAVSAGGAVAESAMAKAVAARQAHYKQLGGAFKAINDEVKKGSPSLAVIQANARVMHQLSLQIPTWFPRGSGAEAKVKTRAKAEIWKDPQGFAAAAKALQAETAKLAAASDLDAAKAQVRPVGGACKGCHDKFRTEEKT